MVLGRLRRVAKAFAVTSREPEQDDGCWGDWMGDWTCDAGDAVSDAWNESGEWIGENADLVGTVVGFAADAACWGIATGATFGLGVAPAGVVCSMVGGAVDSWAASAFEGDSADEQPPQPPEGAVIGGFLGLVGAVYGAAYAAKGALPALGEGTSKSAADGILDKLVPNGTAKAAGPSAADSWAAKLGFSKTSNLSKKYDSHAAPEFKITGPRNGANLNAFKSAVKGRMLKPGVRIYRFNYRNQGQTVGFIDPDGKMVMLHANMGEFWSVPTLGDNKFKMIVDEGALR
ncbi:hypothetical protein AB0I28_14180 [Phytomonospora sp. NPDC050363]|uniref:hypothetical protein n=1 Tax=Phytomonospora sp. NPDC050363 TaxID=3155642 RepID=UPI00341054EB